MNSCGIVGAGTMGSGICLVMARAGMETFLCDISSEIVAKGIDRIQRDIENGVAKGLWTSTAGAEFRNRIHPVANLSDLSGCSMIIEAIVEKLVAKVDLFRKLGDLCADSCIFASNTSSLSITAIASTIRVPERVVGVHFFNPPSIMKLVEIVRGQHTSEETMRVVLDLVRSFGKTPVVVRDMPGFIVNRTARPFYGEALRLLGEGVASVEEIDRIVRNEGGFRMGPFELMDLIGIDVNLAVTQSMYDQTFGEPRYRPHLIQKRMVDAGCLGRKTGRGFYRYDR